MNAHLLTQLRALASATDNEICGALIGERATVTDLWPLSNQSSNPARSFYISAQEVLRTERKARARGLDLIGFYHSHPNDAALPSSSDLAQAVPGYIYAIVDRTGDVRLWRLRADRARFDEVV